jgi:peptide/nickel transport system substrate-binding protein
MARAARLVVVFVSFGLVGAATMPASAQTSSTASPDEKVTFVVGTTGDLNSLNPLRQIDSTESFVSSLMYDGLLRRAQADYTPESEMADSWETSEDGLTWTFHLRDGLTWSDGTPITADDFVWTANFIYDNHISSWYDGYRFMDSVVAQDPQTIVWTTTKPTLVPGLPGYNLLLPEHVWKDVSADEVKTFENYPDPVVSGMYNITEFDQGQSWTMTARPDYWGQKPVIDDIIFRVYNNNEALVQALLKGAIDYTLVPTGVLYDKIKTTPNIGSAVTSAEAFWQLSFNLADDPASTANPAVLDPAFRDAVEAAIDRNTLIDRVLRGYATPGSTPIVPAYPYWHWEPPEDVAIQFNLDNAKAMLDQAGYVDTDGDGIRENPGGGEPLNLRFYLASTDPDGIKAAPFIQNWLREIGVNTEIKTMTDSKLYDEWYAFDWDLIMYSWGTGPDPDFLLSSFTSGQCGYWSDTCYSNPRYDKLYEKQQTTLDQAERQKIVFQMQQIIYDATPEIVLWYPNSFEAWRSDRWEGFVPWPEPDGVRFWDNMFSVALVHPVANAPTVQPESGLPAWLWIVGAVVVVLAIGFLIYRRRRSDAAYG